MTNPKHSTRTIIHANTYQAVDSAVPFVLIAVASWGAVAIQLVVWF